MKTVFVRPELCIGCRHCEVACAIEHAESKKLIDAIQEGPVSEPRIFVEPTISYLTFPNRCRHCDPAPCMQVCPTGALYRDADTGTVAIDYVKCIGCAVCAMACPFGIIQFKNVFQTDNEREVNAKCDNCIERQKGGRIPACAEACKTGALEFGDANELIRVSRKDFSARMIKSAGTDVEVPKIPENIRAYRDIMKKIAETREETA